MANHVSGVRGLGKSPEFLKKAHLFEPVNGHSPVGGSVMARVMACPASVSACYGRPDSGAGKAAAEGTLAHEVAEKMFLATRGANGGFIGGEGKFILFDLDLGDDDMRTYAVQYYDYVAGWLLGEKASIEVEMPVDYTDYMPGGTATADLVAYTDDTLHVFDYKYGMGPVSAYENEQLLSCLLGAYDSLDYLFGFVNLVVHIVQPRIHNFTSWEVPLERLETFRTQLRATAMMIVSDKPRFQPGAKQCQWCRASADCKAQVEKVYAVSAQEFDPVEVEGLSGKEFSDVLDDLDLMEGFAKAARKRALERLTAGYEIPGYKLVRGRKGARQWAFTTDQEIDAWLEENDVDEQDRYTKKSITAVQAEKLGIDVSKVVSQKDGSLTYAPESDKRGAVNPSDEFD